MRTRIDLLVGDGLGGLAQFVEDHRQQFGDLVLAGRGGDAEDAAVGKGPVEGIDRVAEAALFAHFLEQARAHAAAEDRGQNLRGVEAVGIVGAALEAEDDMGLLVVGEQPLLAADIAGLLRRRARRSA